MSEREDTLLIVASGLDVMELLGLLFILQNS